MASMQVLKQVSFKWRLLVLVFSLFWVNLQAYIYTSGPRTLLSFSELKRAGFCRIPSFRDERPILNLRAGIFDFLFRRRGEALKDRVRQNWAQGQELQKAGRSQQTKDSDRPNMSEKVYSDFAYLSGVPAANAPQADSTNRARNLFAEVSEESAQAARARRAQLLGSVPPSPAAPRTRPAAPPATPARPPDPTPPRSASRPAAPPPDADAAPRAPPRSDTLTRVKPSSRTVARREFPAPPPPAAFYDAPPPPEEEEGEARRQRRAEEQRRDAVRTLGRKARAVFGLDDDAYDGPPEPALAPGAGGAGGRGRAEPSAEALPRFKVRANQWFVCPLVEWRERGGEARARARARARESDMSE
jgi:hypothetical protein